MESENKYKEGELTDKELDNVAGGAEGCKPANPYETVYWDREEDVQFLFNIGDLVEAFAQGCQHHTATCKVTNRRISILNTSLKGNQYYDEYWLEKEPGVKSVLVNGWYLREDIEK